MLEKYLKAKVQAKKLWDEFQPFKYYANLAAVLALVIPQLPYTILEYLIGMLTFYPLLLLLRNKKFIVQISRNHSFAMLLEPIVIAFFMSICFFISFISLSEVLHMPEIRSIPNFIALFSICFIITSNNKPKKLVIFKS